MLKLLRILRNGMAAARNRLYTLIIKVVCESYQEPLYVNRRSMVTRHTRLGSNVNFNGMTIEGGGMVVIGNNFHSGRECLMITQIHDFDHGNAVPYDSHRHIMKNIVIGDNVWIGTRVIILGGVTIGEGAIIQAGSVVVSDIPVCGIAGGHPAKVFKFRDVEHYTKLKADGRFV